MSKSDNDILAEYVRERYPEIPRTIDFAFYSLAQRAKEFGANMREAFSAINTKGIENLSKTTFAKSSEKD